MPNFRSLSLFNERLVVAVVVVVVLSQSVGQADRQAFPRTAHQRQWHRQRGHGRLNLDEQFYDYACPLSLYHTRQSVSLLFSLSHQFKQENEIETDRERAKLDFLNILLDPTRCGDDVTACA